MRSVDLPVEGGADEPLEIGKVIPIVRAGRSIGVSEDIAFRLALRLGRVCNGSQERGVRVVELHGPREGRSARPGPRGDARP